MKSRALLFVATSWMILGAVVPATQVTYQRSDFVGDWVSETKTSNVTTLQPDGRFRTRYYRGLVESGSVTGTWTLRDKTIVWTYEGANLPPGEDVNPIVEWSKDRFVLKEEDGSLSPPFFRKGVVDPKSPPHLPVAIGTGWLLEDDDKGGEMAIRIGIRERVGASDAYRVDWIDGPMIYQSEYWIVDDAGVHAVGRNVLGRAVVFAAPYVLLRKTLNPGDSWAEQLKFDARSESLKFTVGSPKKLNTPSGEFEATPVTLTGPALEIRRWYAAGIGLVQEESDADFGSGGVPLNTKRLKRRLQ